MKAFILAGGFGTRLAPYTKVLPKPLLPIGERPILDILLEQLSLNGVDEAVLATGYKAELIRSYFGESKYGIRIGYSHESKRLGTAGPLGIFGGFSEPFFLMNADILTTLDFSRMMKFHVTLGSFLTVATCRREERIQLGIVKSEGNRVVDFIEKPTYDFFVSMGVYVLDPKVVQHINRDEYLDMPDLIRDLISGGKNIIEYRTDAYWIDIGRPDDYGRAQEEFKKIQRKILRR